MSVLSATRLSREKELYARQRAWWAANDTFRITENATVSFAPAQAENLRVLADIQ